MRNKKIGLVLSGGGTRGLAHIGVLESIEKLNIKIDYVAGCSIGAIIGAFYAAGKSSEEIKEFILKHKLIDFFDFSFSNVGIKKTKKLQEKIDSFLGCKSFKDLKIPLFINATNISKGKEKVFSSGNLFKAIRASISVPGVFAPVKNNQNWFVDGGVINQVPFDILPSNVSKFIIVNASPFEKFKNISKMNLVSLLDSSLKLMQVEIFKEKISNLDKNDYVFIEPNLDKNFILENRKKFKSIIKKGRIATNKKKKEIIAKILN
jgi:NTE family protein